MCLDDVRYCICGAGQRGIECARCMRMLEMPVKAFIDNNPELFRKSIEGIIVHSMKETNLFIDNYFIIASSKYENEMTGQLSQEGVGAGNIISSSELESLLLERIKELFGRQYHQNDCLRLSDEQIRLLYDHQIFAMNSYGGVLRTFYELITNIARTNDCLVDMFHGGYISRYDYNVSTFFRYYGFRCDMAGNYYINRINHSLFREFTKDQRYDIYHATYYDDIYECNCKKRVITIHDMIPELVWKEAKFTAIKKRNIDAADGIIAVSENTKKDLMNLYDIDEKKIKVIYHGNSLRNIACDPVSGYEFPYILYVGKREGYKNAELLAKAFSRCPYRKELKLLFFGGDEFTPQEREQFEELGISNEVVHSKGDDKALANTYAHAEVFVYPSLYEGFGIPVLEAMGCGCPVIASESSSIPEVGGNAVRYFEPDSEDSLLEAMNDVLGNKELRAELINLGLKREKLFSWEKTAQETLDFYKELLGC